MATCDQDPRVIVIGRHGQSDQLRYTLEDSDADARRVRLSRGQQVRWRTENGEPWAVEFEDDDSPLPEAVYGARGKGPAVAVRDDAPRKTYKYSVEMTVEEGEVITDDPEFRID